MNVYSSAARRCQSTPDSLNVRNASSAASKSFGFTVSSLDYDADQRLPECHDGEDEQHRNRDDGDHHRREYEMSDNGSDEAGYRMIMFHFLGFLFCPGCRCFHTRQALEHVPRCCELSGRGLPHTLHTLRSPMGNAAMTVSSFIGFLPPLLTPV